MAPAKSPNIGPIRKARLGPEADALDREFWAALTPDERVERTWELSLHQWLLQGGDVRELGLCRSVARVIRR